MAVSRGEDEMLALPENFDQEGLELPERRVRHPLVVDEDTALTRNIDLPPNQNLLVRPVSQTDAVQKLLDRALRLPRRLEPALDEGHALARPDQFGPAAPPQQKPQRVHDDRFAGPRLARQKAEPRTQFERQA